VTTGGVLEELPPQAATMNAKKHSAILYFITWFTLTLQYFVSIKLS